MDITQTQDSISISGFSCKDTVKELSGMALEHGCDVKITNSTIDESVLLVITGQCGAQKDNFLNAVLLRAAKLLGIQ